MIGRGKSIIRDVLSEHQICADDFFGLRRDKHLTLARTDAAKRLHAAGYDWSSMARIMKRNHSTVRYYVLSSHRDRKRQYYRDKYAMRFMDAGTREVVLAAAEAEGAKPEVIIAQWVADRALHEAQAKRAAA